MTWKSSSYSSSDMMAMQRDAVRRVQEMQRIAKSKVGGTQEPTPAPPAAMPVPPASKKEQRPPAEKKETAPAPGGKNFLQDLLPGLNIDSDRLIILLLLIVLMNEGTDSKLLLALCYLLL